LVSQAITRANRIRDAVQVLKTVSAATWQDKYLMYNVDPLKVVIKISGLNGTEIRDLLETKYEINIEKVTKRAATITVHSHINDEDTAALIAALKDIDENNTSLDGIEAAHT
jgi:arginine/lysine/ornithine decarboxylase